MKLAFFRLFNISILFTMFIDILRIEGFVLKLSYVLRRVFTINTRGFFDKVKEVSEKSSKSKVFVFFDMINCGFKYQAGYMDYAVFEMYNLSKDQRKTIITRGINNSFIKRFNNPEYRHIFADKRKFNSAFSSFVNRGWLDLEKACENELEGFLKNNPVFFAKVSNGMCGKGIEKLSASDFASSKELREYLLSKNLYLIEEQISQHKEMAMLNPSSVNSCRVVTLFKDGKASVLGTYLKIGNGKHVDNFNSGGMVVPVDEISGEVLFPAVNKKGEVFEAHPQTGVKIEGFKVPMWDDILTLAKNASRVISQVGLVGWDIALAEKGPLIIEGNDFPGHDIYGLPPHRKETAGLLPKFEKIMNS